MHCVVTSPPYWGLRDYGVDGQIGLEASPELFVARMVEVFREVKRVLRKDGTCWVNLGDSYNSNSGSGFDSNQTGNLERRKKCKLEKIIPIALPSKNLVGIPWRVAFALQADGWFLRSDIIWAKPNPMPESVSDRPTKAHEYIFLLTKSAKYFYDSEAIKEGCSPATHARVAQDLAAQVGSFRANGGNKTNGPMKAVVAGSTRKIAESGQGKRNGSYEAALCLQVASRNKRTVWTVASAPYKEAHFATFPPDLIKPCILAGTSAKGCCALCGAPRVRVVEKVGNDRSHGANGTKFQNGSTANRLAALRDSSRAAGGEYVQRAQTVDWVASCNCVDGKTVACTVLDPFGGSGTTGQVSLSLGRRAVLIELNAEYCELARRRTDVTPLFSQPVMVAAPRAENLEMDLIR